MQVNQNQIKRPSLIEPFFNEELTPDNEYVTYIDCSTNASAVVHKKSVTPTISNNIEKQLNNKRFYRFVDNALMGKKCSFPHSIKGNDFVWAGGLGSLFVFIRPELEKEEDYYKQYENFSIFDEISAIA